MLTLIAGSAIDFARRSRLALPVAEDRLFVVPDELSAVALTREIYGEAPGFSGDEQIVAFDRLLQKLTDNEANAGQWIPAEVALALVRQILESDPGAFDYLVGSHSAPRLSHGVLERIYAAMESFQKSQQAEEPPQMTSIRSRQLKQLAERFEERLTAAGSRLEKYGQLEALSGLTKARWKKLYPDVNHVVFLDFIDHSDAEYMAIHAVSRCVKQCDVLLDFDPLDEAHGESAMETAYMRFHDMAEKILLEPELPASGQVDLFEQPPAAEPEQAGETSQRRPPVVVHADSVAQEVSHVAAAVRKLLDEAEEGNTPSLVVSLTSWDTYAPALEKAFDDHGIVATWQQTRSPIRGGEWLLLDRLRQCCGHSVSGSALSALLRAPGFNRLLPGDITTVELWDLASRLDYVLTLTGKLQAWGTIRKETGFMLDRLRKERQRKALWTQEEGRHDERLKEVLSHSQDVLQAYAKKLPLRQWSQQVTSVLGALSASADDSASDAASLRREVINRMRDAALKLARYSGLFTDEAVEFRRFLSLYRTLLYRDSVDNLDEMQSHAVTVCTPAVASRLRSDCCLLLGCNDGNFPRFARPEAAFLAARFHTTQAGALARQRITLHRIIRNHATALLWMPRRIDTEQALPSQFIEELLSRGQATEVEADVLLKHMGARLEGKVGRRQAELVENLRGLILSENELQRLHRRSPRAYQVAHGISLLAQRSHAHLGGYDGVITDPVLKPWLRQWAARHIYSVSQLDTIVGCSFRFFVERILNLEEPEEADDLLPAHAFGSFAHDVLAVFYRKWVSDGRQVPRPEDEMQARHELFRAYAAEFEEVSDLSEFAMDLLNLKLFGELGAEGFRDGYRELVEVRDPGIFGQFLLLEMSRGGSPGMDFLKPTAFEVGFGMGLLPEDDPLSMENCLELDLGEGEHVKLRGRIDRIDMSPTGVYAVIDYKTGKVPTQKSIVDSYRTQLPVYVMIGRKLLQAKYPQAEAAGGLYYSLRKGDNAKVSGAFFRADYQQQVGVSGRCLKDDAFEGTLNQVKNIMRRSIRSVRDGQLTTTWRDEEIVCGYCPFEGFCYRNVDRTREFWSGMEAMESEADQ